MNFTHSCYCPSGFIHTNRLVILLKQSEICSAQQDVTQSPAGASQLIGKLLYQRVIQIQMEAHFCNRVGLESNETNALEGCTGKKQGCRLGEKRRVHDRVCRVHDRVRRVQKRRVHETNALHAGARYARW